MPSYLVTGVNRGIGLALVHEWLKDPQNLVIGTVREPGQCASIDTLLQEYPRDRFIALALDLAIRSTIDKLAETVAGLLPESGLDYLIHNAAACSQKLTPFEHLDPDVLEEELRVNTVAPLYLLQKLLPSVRKGSAKKILLLSSCMGSIQNAPFFVGCTESYSITKAGINMIGRKWGALLKTEGITVVVVHPGWVDTEMGSYIDEWVTKNFPEQQNISAVQAAEGTLKAVEFYMWDGTKLPW
ncbi:hypothetical protein FOMPIDRAFT_1033256 [Fomitopsis schrenkii]|uniref:NAD-binding protein n=1 Tax=Fomitopsis schrenkii TaxID=2126942 RepID=S8DPP4_FOMSC|nr:hypothetical protein FOMPIDRAFT_1033256 [Fomitopsis schrenkii]